MSRTAGDEVATWARALLGFEDPRGGPDPHAAAVTSVAEGLAVLVDSGRLIWLELSAEVETFEDCSECGGFEWRRADA